jgi:hypothetical protein
MVIGFLALTNQVNAKPNLKGKKYLGKPVAEKSYSGCEGCGERGYFHFAAQNNQVEFVWPGSDLISNGNYTISGQVLKIMTQDKETLIFTISKNLREITYRKNKMRFKDEKYPWQ